MSNTTNLMILLFFLVCTYVGVTMNSNNENNDCLPGNVNSNSYGSTCKVEDDLNTLRSKAAGKVDEGSKQYKE
jgi:hypothetical protein